ncbi:hypothetical protein [Accumulibacter sp.]|uniref:hypothetical protein n=1 Tax=Accumulibacter sp. TaxID=2053492 RepID=UPI0028C43936|nr:hypothetical protein [Accumulibacter sp.]
MSMLIRLVVSALLIFTVQPSLAIQPGGLNAVQTTSASSTNLVERGGTVDAIDSNNRTIVVDGVSYEFQSVSVKINPLAGDSKQKAFKLKAGMQIRFSTARNYSSGRDQVREVWVSSVGGSTSGQ